MTSNITLDMIKIWPSLIFQIPEADRTYDMYMNAVGYNGIRLFQVPSYCITKDMCMAASKNREMEYSDIPEVHRSESLDIFLASTRLYLRDIPSERQTYDVCLAAVTRYGGQLDDVPLNYRDHKLCLTAVSKDGAALEHVPSQFRDSIMCLEAVKSYGRAIAHVPQKLITTEMCKLILKSDHIISVHQYIPQEMITSDVLSDEACIKVIVESPHYICYIPEFRLTSELLLTAVRENSLIVRYLPDHKITNEMLLMVATFGSLDYVSNTCLTLEACKIAVLRDVYNMRYVPYHFKLDVARFIAEKQVVEGV